MFIEILLLLAGLLVILAAAEIFTNGVEALGRRLSLSQAVVGSLLAAVGTAMPETVLPLVAIFFYSGESAKDIGVGAILGAPFMLSTLAFFLVGLTVAISAFVKRRRFEIHVETHSTRRDLIFFIPMYAAAVLIPIAIGRSFDRILAVALVFGYVLYAYRTFKGESSDLEHSEEMYIVRILRKIGMMKSEDTPLVLAAVQVIVSLVIMVEGARAFVSSLEHVAVYFGMNPLLFALLLAPVATELPEKFNSVSWTWKGRDTLAIGNITGAMVFQSTFPVSVGLLFTDWKLTGMALFSAVIALVSAMVILTEIVLRRKISPFSMLFGGVLYLIYAVALASGAMQ